MPTRSHARSRLPLVLLSVLVGTGVLLGLEPRHRADWALENALAAAALLGLVYTHRRFPLSNVSYVSIFLFLMLHELGAHYTYSEVPYDAWCAALTGRGLNDWLGFERNHFDRLVHFTYGLLVAYPMRELFVRIAGVRGFWGYFLPLEMVMSTSMFYELIEWGAAISVGGDLGQAYLGTQGDPWDAHKDMLLATVGAVIALAIAASIHRALNRDFQHEWAESLKVARSEPLGEVAIERLKKRPTP